MRNRLNYLRLFFFTHGPQFVTMKWLSVPDNSWCPLPCCREFLQFCQLPPRLWASLFHSAQHMDPPCHRQGKEQSLVSSVPARCAAAPGEQSRQPGNHQCSISGPKSQEPPAPAEEASFGNGGRNEVSLEMLPFVRGLVTNGGVEGVTEQIHAFCCHKEKGFREGEEISKFLTFSTVIIHFCPLAAISSLFQLQSCLPGYSSSIQ